MFGLIYLIHIIQLYNIIYIYIQDISFHQLSDKNFPINIPDVPEHINSTIDYNEWMHPNDRKGGGI